MTPTPYPQPLPSASTYGADPSVDAPWVGADGTCEINGCGRKASCSMVGISVCRRCHRGFVSVGFGAVYFGGHWHGVRGATYTAEQCAAFPSLGPSRGLQAPPIHRWALVRIAIRGARDLAVSSTDPRVAAAIEAAERCERERTPAARAAAARAAEAWTAAEILASSSTAAAEATAAAAAAAWPEERGGAA